MEMTFFKSEVEFVSVAELPHDLQDNLAPAYAKKPTALSFPGAAIAAATTFALTLLFGASNVSHVRLQCPSEPTAVERGSYESPPGDIVGEGAWERVRAFRATLVPAAPEPDGPGPKQVI